MTETDPWHTNVVFWNRFELDFGRKTPSCPKGFQFSKSIQVPDLEEKGVRQVWQYKALMLSPVLNFKSKAWNSCVLQTRDLSKLSQKAAVPAIPVKQSEADEARILSCPLLGSFPCETCQTEVTIWNRSPQRAEVYIKIQEHFKEQEVRYTYSIHLCICIHIYICILTHNMHSLNLLSTHIY